MSTRNSLSIIQVAVLRSIYITAEAGVGAIRRARRTTTRWSARMPNLSTCLSPGPLYKKSRFGLFWR
jgi:hypothetical protein